MNKEEIQDILEELHLVRPEILQPKARKLFEAIMSIADERDELQQENKRLKEVIDDTYENSELIQKENTILKENAIHNDKVLDSIRWENKELKEKFLKQTTETYLRQTRIDKAIELLENCGDYYEGDFESMKFQYDVIKILKDSDVDDN